MQEEAGGRTCRSVENKRGTETASEYNDHEVSDDYQHKERKRRRRRGLKRKVSAHSSEEGERGIHRRGETNAEQTSDDISQEGTPEPRQHNNGTEYRSVVHTHKFECNGGLLSDPAYL